MIEVIDQVTTGIWRKCSKHHALEEYLPPSKNSQQEIPGF